MPKMTTQGKVQLIRYWLLLAACVFFSVPLWSSLLRQTSFTSSLGPVINIGGRQEGNDFTSGRHGSTQDNKRKDVKEALSVEAKTDNHGDETPGRQLRRNSDNVSRNDLVQGSSQTHNFGPPNRIDTPLNQDLAKRRKDVRDAKKTDQQEPTLLRNDGLLIDDTDLGEQTDKNPGVDSVQVLPPAGELRVPLRQLREPALPHRTWFTRPECRHFGTWFSRGGSLPDARLASFYRSGNTWVRYLLEAASGLVTCGGTWKEPTGNESRLDAAPFSVNELRQFLTGKRKQRTFELNRLGYLAEDMPPGMQNCVVTKTHTMPPVWRAPPGGESGYPLPTILLVRDPFKAIISFRHFLINYSVLTNRSSAPNSEFTGDGWNSFVMQMSEYWFNVSSEWASSPSDTLLVPYELIAENMEVHIRNMLEFLGISVPNERINCVLKESEGIAHNDRHNVVPTRSVFNSPIRTLVWDYITRLNRHVLSKGFEKLPVRKYSFAEEFI